MLSSSEQSTLRHPLRRMTLIMLKKGSTSRSYNLWKNCKFRLPVPTKRSGSLPRRRSDGRDDLAEFLIKHAVLSILNYPADLFSIIHDDDRGYILTVQRLG